MRPQPICPTRMRLLGAFAPSRRFGRINGSDTPTSVLPNVRREKDVVIASSLMSSLELAANAENELSAGFVQRVEAIVITVEGIFLLVGEIERFEADGQVLSQRL